MGDVFLSVSSGRDWNGDRGKQTFRDPFGAKFDDLVVFQGSSYTGISMFRLNSSLIRSGFSTISVAVATKRLFLRFYYRVAFPFEEIVHFRKRLFPTYAVMEPVDMNYPDRFSPNRKLDLIARGLTKIYTEET